MIPQITEFAAIDFETANQHRTSVCSVGIVIVKGLEIVDTFYSLIKPLPDFYSYFTTEIHSLTSKDTKYAPSFPAVWQKIAPKLTNLPLIAHNKTFDEGCLKSVFSEYKMNYETPQFYCTCKTSKKLFKDLPNHQLQTVAQYCGHRLDHHHNALEDAMACASIAIHIIKKLPLITPK